MKEKNHLTYRGKTIQITVNFSQKPERSGEVQKEVAQVCSRAETKTKTKKPTVDQNSIQQKYPSE